MTRHLEGLTERERTVYAALCNYIKEYAYPPTVQELADLTGYASKSTVHQILRALQKQGLIVVNAGSRAIRTATLEVVEKTVDLKVSS